MKKLISLIGLILLTGCMSLMAQNSRHINLDSDTHGETIDGPEAGLILYDDGGQDNAYSHGYDYHCIIRSTCDQTDTSTTHLSVHLLEWHIGRYDTLYIYDGPTVNDPLIVKLNDEYPPTQQVFYISSTNSSHMLCVRFRSSVQHPDDTLPHSGFMLEFFCEKPCESFTTVIDSTYERVDKDGNVLATDHTRLFPILQTDSVVTYTDSLWDGSLGTYVMTDSVKTLQTDTVGWIDGVQLCMGQCIRFHGHGEYGNTLGWYTANDENTHFRWDLGTGDSVAGVNATSSGTYCGFSKPGCYNIFLSGTDVNGCPNKNSAQVQVRIAQNPIKTIYDLSTICNDDSLLVNVGYDGDNGTLTLKKIQFATVVSKTNQERTFIPDGPNCAVQCYNAPVEFNEFPGQSIRSANDICSICINYEHSYMGDYSLAITCPTYDPSVSATQGKAFLKYQMASDIPSGSEAPNGTWGGGGRYTGVPYGGSRMEALHYDNGCDALDNPYGEGLDYCFSRNNKYTLITGEPCDTHNPAAAGLATGNLISYTTTLTPMTSPYPASACVPLPPVTVTTTEPSDHDNKSGYFTPADDFSTLVGCPLNGQWNIEVCDKWSADNGWVFGWSMDLCNISSADTCDYQVGIDKVLWQPESSNAFQQNEDGSYRGLMINMLNNSTAAYVSTPDTAGTFGIKISIYDDFGCQWDTTTHITSVFTPEPNLGKDTIMCGESTMQLDARDRHTAKSNYSYLWEPYGETSAVVTTRPSNESGNRYIVRVDNYMHGQHCSTRDTININVYPQPIPSFDPGQYPLEGCEPMTVNFVNTTRDGYSYRWDFGDGNYSTAEHPSHTYGAGSYDLKYYVESEHGCKASLIYPGLVTVFAQPEAQFSWQPAVPTVDRPTITLHNGTTPSNGGNIYRWEIQYDRDKPYSVHTLTEANPTWTWEAATKDELAGNYAVRLIAMADNRGPSGKLVVCSDTVESNILVINDDLQYPNVVTPNGDGMNDRFVIKNLVEGMAYPMNQLDVYDQWGKPVYSATNISKMDDFWDPNQKNSPAGTYYYHFLGKGYHGNVEHNGVIEVIR